MYIYIYIYVCIYIYIYIYTYIHTHIYIRQMNTDKNKQELWAHMRTIEVDDPSMWGEPEARLVVDMYSLTAENGTRFEVRHADRCVCDINVMLRHL
jgi:hypothetical protein